MRRHAGHDLLVILWSCQSVFGPLRPVALYIFLGKFWDRIDLSTCPSKLLGLRARMNHMVRTKILNRNSRRVYTGDCADTIGLCLATPPYCDSMIRVFKEGLSPQSWPSKPSTNSRRAKSSPQHPAFHCPILERLRMAVPQRKSQISPQDLMQRKFGSLSIASHYE
ncbi:hypothetical protein EDB84DRAFT_494900 [Lactarius hengduanensis]|nr:hypothetical protein EDB84DRAFT_494900 [Lactarius hengduanensis]